MSVKSNEFAGQQTLPKPAAIMLALILQIIFSSAFALIIKWAQRRGKEDEITFGAINYITAAVCVAPFLYLDWPDEISIGAAYAGGAMGVIYFMAYFLVIHAIRNVGVASTTVVSVLSILLPIGLAAVLYDEHPHWAQWVGIGLALAALTLIGVPAKENKKEFLVAGSTLSPTENEDLKDETDRRWVVPVILALFFLLCGFSRVAQEAFKHIVDLEQQPTQRPIFLVSAFGAAAVPSFLTLLIRRRKIKLMELGTGIAMGVSNVLQTFFILQALQYFSGFIVFPVSSAGGVLLVTLVATCLLGERLTKQTLIGISLSVIALFLLNSA